jgi:hypothetical protein
MPILERIQKEYADELVLLAINLEESRDEVRDYVRREGIRSRVLLDSDGKVGRIYRSEAIPMHVLIDKEGEIRDIQVGLSPEGKLREQIDRLR